MRPCLILILAAAAAFWAPTPASAQAPNRRIQLRDSLISELKRTIPFADSLRKTAMRQDTIVRSSDRMVDFLKTTSDTTLLAGWKQIQEHVTRSFDSTLNRLDSCTILLNRLSDALDSLTRKKPGASKNLP
jgi:hypothetical protein